MNRLLTRLVLSHVLVVAVGVATTFVVVRQWAPALFDQQMGPGMMTGSGNPMRGTGGALRDQFSSAVDQALLVGALAGGVAAALLGVVFAVRLIRPVERVRAATARMAQGDYAVAVPVPRETELAALVSDVNQLGDRLASTEARRVALLGDVAHEMRTPLTVIDGYVEGMIDGVIRPGPEELAEVGAEVRRLRRLADDLSALSRAEEDRVALARARVDLGDVVSAAAQRLDPQASDAGLALTIVRPPSPVAVDADPDRIAQVVTNLVGNAVRATPPGGSIEVTVGESGGTARFAVADTGVGLTAEEVTRVFERFYRGEQPPGGRSEGSGIGLTIARRIMQAHGGDLAAASPGRGGGATFTATLPVAR